MQSTTFRDKQNFVSIIVSLLRNKSEVADKFAEFVAFAQTQIGKVVKALR